MNKQKGRQTINLLNQDFFEKYLGPIFFSQLRVFLNSSQSISDFKIPFCLDVNTIFSIERAKKGTIVASYNDSVMTKHFKTFCSILVVQI